MIQKLREQAATEGKGLFEGQEPEDLGFKVFKLAESGFRQWDDRSEEDGEAYADKMALFADPLRPGWKAVDVIYEVALKEGYSLTSRIEKVAGVKGNTVHRVTDADKGQSFLICLDKALNDSALKALGLTKETVFICRDVALTDKQAANLALQCVLKTI